MILIGMKAREIIRIWTKRKWNYSLISVVTIWLHIQTLAWTFIMFRLSIQCSQCFLEVIETRITENGFKFYLWEPNSILGIIKKTVCSWITAVLNRCKISPPKPHVRLKSTLGANSSTIYKSYSLVFETVLPPITCLLMSRSPSKLKCFAMGVLRLCRRKSCRRQMKEWPRIKTRMWGIKKKEIKENTNKGSTCLKRFCSWSGRGWWPGREGRITGVNTSIYLLKTLTLKTES